MPAYDFRCKACRHTFTLSVDGYHQLEHLAPACPSCGGAELSRLIRQITVLTTGQQRADRLSDPSLLSSLDPDDPRSMGKLMRIMSEESGEPLEGDVNEVVERLESGEDPSTIEQSMGADSAGTP